MIKEAILKEMKDRNQDFGILSKEIGVKYSTLYWVFNRSERGSIPILEKCLKYYNLEIVKKY